MKSQKIYTVCTILLAILLIATFVKSIIPFDTYAHEENISTENPHLNVIAPVKIENRKTQYTDKKISINKYEEETTISDKNYYSAYDIYIWAKIVMCEAEGESQKCKEYVAQVIKNRVESNDFPNTIYDVVFQENQFTPTFDGRWEKVEPNKNCYNAVYTVLKSEYPITDALFFEACSGESWHSNNLVKVAEIDNTRFYK